MLDGVYISLNIDNQWRQNIQQQIEHDHNKQHDPLLIIPKYQSYQIFQMMVDELLQLLVYFLLLSNPLKSGCFKC